MKFKISKAEWEKLSDEQKATYTAKGDDYQLQIDGLPDYDGMEKKLNTLLDEAKTAKKGKADAEAKAAADAELAAKNSGDIAALEKSWGDKLAQATAQTEAIKQQYHGQISKLMVTNEAQALASKLFGKNATPLLHNVQSRLTLEEAEDGSFKTRVLGADGKPSAASLADLEKEFSGNEAYRPFLVTTKATGPTGGVQNSNQSPVNRPTGFETPGDRRERARQIASEAAENSGNSY